jgi:transcriptional regulator with XRE-family HTH domain
MATKSMGERIKELRLEVGISLRQLASKTGKSPAFISDVELGRRYPSDDALSDIAKVLNVAEDELKSLDTRSSLEDIKKLAQRDPNWGMAFRTAAESAESMSPQEFIERLTMKKK